eukprot:1767747-Amphidinium_carterae.2
MQARTKGKSDSGHMPSDESEHEVAGIMAELHQLCMAQVSHPQFVPSDQERMRTLLTHVEAPPVGKVFNTAAIIKKAPELLKGQQLQ